MEEKILDLLKKNNIDVQFNEETKTLNIDYDASEINVSLNKNFMSVVIMYSNKLIPEEIKDIIPYIEKWEGNITIDNGTLKFDTEINGDNYFCHSVMSDKNRELCLNNWVNDIDKINECVWDGELEKEKIEGYKKSFNLLKRYIEKMGYSFMFSHYGDSFDNVYSLIVPFEAFNMENVIKCCKKWRDYNKQFNKVLDNER